MFKKKKIKEEIREELKLNCKNCLFHADVYCKRYPPIVTDKNGVYAEYPLVYDDGLCGEFRNVT